MNSYLFLLASQLQKIHGIKYVELPSEKFQTQTVHAFMDTEVVRGGGVQASYSSSMNLSLILTHRDCTEG